MLITYFDEVKFQKGRQPYYWLGGIVAESQCILQLEEKLSELSEQVFGSRELLRETEFHAADIMNGHEHFKGWDWDRRIDTLKRLTTIFCEADGISCIYVRIDPSLMVGTDIEGNAFMFFVERVDSYLRARDQVGLLIGDRESEAIAGHFAERLSKYRAGGTHYAFGTKLTHLVDTVHFTHSHHSRMLQLADLHTWLRQLCQLGAQEKWHREQIIQHVSTLPNRLAAVRYKHWPTKDSWSKVPAQSL